MPDWLPKLLKRLAGLTAGRYCLILTIGKEVDWTLTDLGKVEK